MMLSLLGQDPKANEKIAECKSRIRDLKEKLKQYMENRGDITSLQQYNKKHPLPQSNDRGVRPPFLRARKRLPGHFGKIYALHWSSNSEDIVSASQDGKLLIWNAISTNKKVAIPLRSAWVMTCAFSPQNKYVASGGLDNLCSIFNIQDSIGWEIRQPFRELQQHEGYLSECKFIDDSQIVTASGDGTIIHWDIEKQTPIKQFSEHGGDVQSVAVLKERNLLVSGAIDAKAKVWDWRLGSCIASFGGHESDINSVRWFPDGYAFASGSDDATCRLFDLRAHGQLNKYHGDDIFSTVTKIDFSKSGSYLFVGYDEDPTCLGWDVLTAEKVMTLQHQTRCSCIETAPNGYSVATGCWDKILRIWA